MRCRLTQPVEPDARRSRTWCITVITSVAGSLCPSDTHTKVYPVLLTLFSVQCWTLHIERMSEQQKKKTPVIVTGRFYGASSQHVGYSTCRPSVIILQLTFIIMVYEPGCKYGSFWTGGMGFRGRVGVAFVRVLLTR